MYDRNYNRMKRTFTVLLIIVCLAAFRIECAGRQTAMNESELKAKKITAHMTLVHTTGLDNKTYKDIVYKDLPGEKYRYSGPGIHLLDLTIGHILGKDLRDYSKDYIFDKIGMEHSNYFWQDEYDWTAACGYLANGKWRYNKSWEETLCFFTNYETRNEFINQMISAFMGNDIPLTSRRNR